MRAVVATALLLAAASSGASAQADPYRFCALYGNGGDLGGIRSCYFMTEEACRATLSGLGGLCIPNPFYTGPAPAPAAARRGKKPTA